MTVNRDQVKGALKDIGGKIQEEAGKLVGSTKHQVAGLKEQAKGKIQKLSLIHIFPIAPPAWCSSTRCSARRCAAGGAGSQPAPRSCGWQRDACLG